MSAETTTDRWGQEVAGAAGSVAAWNRAWEQFLHFHGDPPGELAASNSADETFVMGPVLAATYAVLGGMPLDSPDLVTNLHHARSRAAAAPAREAAHVEALEHVVAGNFSLAAQRWDDIARNDHDFAAVRFAHDVFLHVGDADGRIASSQLAIDKWSGQPGANFIAGQYAFALEEVGRYEQAEEVGLGALAADPDDLWARHALAHVYESTENNEAAFELLQGSVDIWATQESLAAHIWWHLALRLLAVGDAAAVLEIADAQMPSATSPFNLCDQASLLWRTELAGFDVGDRWDAVADRWDDAIERHTCAFIDVHAVMAFARRPNHPGAERWFAGLAARPPVQGQNDKTFQEVVTPLATAFRSFAAGQHGQFLAVTDELAEATSRIGGSVAQRDIIELTRRAAGATT